MSEETGARWIYLRCLLDYYFAAVTCCADGADG